MFQIPAIDIEAVSRKAREAHQAAVLRAREPGRFVGVSLGAWLERVEAAGVPSVPATRIATIGRDAYLALADHGNPAADEKLADLLSALARLDDSVMVRFDACSGIELKQAMAEGRAPSKTDRQDLLGFDPRAYDIVHEFPADEIDIWFRPWIDTMVVDGYPVEFRVFVENGEVLGVASYYPQRPLPPTPEMNALAGYCIRQSFTILQYLRQSQEAPWMPTYEGKFEDGKVSATLDFIVNTEGQALFLEAGPPFGAGAHPCAFIDRPIKGVALEMAPGVALR